MATHHPFEIEPLSRVQQLKVKKGEPIIIKPKQTAKVVVLLDTLQFEKAKKAHGKGKGIKVVLSPTHNAHVHTGEGGHLFHDIGGILGQAGGEFLGSGVKKHHAVKHHAVKHHGKGVFGDIGNALGGVAGKYLDDYTGVGLKNNSACGRGKRKVIKGKGWFADHVGRPIASNLIHKGLPMAGGVAGGLAGSFLAPASAGLSVPAGSLIGSSLGEVAGHNIGRWSGYGKKPQHHGKGVFGDIGNALGGVAGKYLDDYTGVGIKRHGLRSHLVKKHKGGAMFPAGGSIDEW